MTSSDTLGTLVVGGGQAGVQVASSLRELGYDGPVALVCDELPLPYHRPPLSKELFRPGPPAQPTKLRAERFYEEAGIELIRGERIVDLDLPDSFPHSPGVARTDQRRTLRFDRLALAVGGRSRELSVPGTHLAGVCRLRTIGEFQVLRSALSAAQDVVVVGAGFIGLEVASAAAAAGKNVTVVEYAPRVLDRAGSGEISDFLHAAHLRRGVTFRLGAAAVAFRARNGRVCSVTLADGNEIPADVVVVGVGLVPATDLAAAIGLEHDRDGILVDDSARTSRAGIVAAGDCTVRDGRLRLESVHNAVTQGRQAAVSILGANQDRAAVPWFWSDQADLKLQIAGLHADHDEVVVRGAPGDESFSVLYYRQGQLTSIHSINAPGDFILGRRTLQEGWNIPPHLAGDVSQPLKSLVERVIASV